MFTMKPRPLVGRVIPPFSMATILQRLTMWIIWKKLLHYLLLYLAGSPPQKRREACWPPSLDDRGGCFLLLLAFPSYQHCLREGNIFLNSGGKGELELSAKGCVLCSGEAIHCSMTHQWLPKSWTSRCQK